MKMERFSALRVWDVESPRQKRMASIILDLPEPFGPLMVVKPLLNGIFVLLEKDLKFQSSMSFMCNAPSPNRKSIYAINMLLDM
jgi:hypothetical protein